LARDIKKKLDADDQLWPAHFNTVTTLPCEMQKS